MLKNRKRIVAGVLGTILTLGAVMPANCLKLQAAPAEVLEETAQEPDTAGERGENSQTDEPEEGIVAGELQADMPGETDENASDELQESAADEPEKSVSDEPEEIVSDEPEAKSASAGPEEKSTPDSQAGKNVPGEPEEVSGSDQEAGDGRQAELPEKTDRESTEDGWYRLIVEGGDRAVRGKDEVLSEYDGIRLMQFDSKDDALEALHYYQEKAEFAAFDERIRAADQEAGPADPADPRCFPEAMTKKDNPLAELEGLKKVKTGGRTIALIDTGADNVKKRISVTGGDGNDVNGHGTKMASHILQMNPDADILSIQALDSDGSGTVSSIYAALRYAIDQKAGLISLSVSGPASEAAVLLEDLIKEAAGKGIQVTGAAGNNGADASLYIPGKVKEAVITGACDAKGKRRASSNYGKTVDYYVHAETTSEAAAKMAGILSLGGELQVNTDPVFEADYKPEERKTRRMQVYFNFMEGEENGMYANTYGAGIDAAAEDGWIRVLVNEDPEQFDFSGMRGPQVIINDAAEDGRTKYITDECRYDKKLGYMFIPEKYIDENLTVRVHLPVGGSAWEYYTPDALKGKGPSMDVPPFGSRFDARIKSMKEKGILEAADNSAFLEADWGNWNTETWLPVAGSSNDVRTDQDMRVFLTLPKNKWLRLDQGAVTYIGTGTGGEHAAEKKRNAENTGTYSGFSKNKLGDTTGFAVHYTHFTEASLSKEQRDALNAIWGSAGLGGTGKGQSAFERSVAYGTYTQFSGRNWMYGFCVSGYGNGYHGDPEFDERAYVNIKNVEENSDGTITVTACFYVFTTAASASGAERDAQNVGGVFRITGEAQKNGRLLLRKKTSAPQVSAGNENYALTGAEYGIYASRSDADSKKNAVKILKTNSAGEAGPAELEEGTYYIREIKAPKGYQMNTSVQSVKISADEDSTLSVSDRPAAGAPDPLLSKKDGLTEDGTAQGDAKLKGAAFEVTHYARAKGTLLHTWVFTSDQDGVISLKEENRSGGDALIRDEEGAAILPLGYYTVKEISAPEGYLVNEKEYHFSVTADTDTGKAKVQEMEPVGEEVITGGVKAAKTDAELTSLRSEDDVTQENVQGDVQENVQGDAALAGAEFTVYNRSGKAVVVNGKRCEPGDEVLKIRTGADGIAATGQHDLPYGSYEIRETGAPEGYLLNSEWSRSFEIRKDGEVTDLTGQACPDQVVRGDLQIEKRDLELDKNEPLAEGMLSGISFEVENRSAHSVLWEDRLYKPGEVVTVAVTDKEGRASVKDLPYGTYMITEKGADRKQIGANDAYLRTETEGHEVQIHAQGGTVEEVFRDQIRRNGLRFRKAGNKDQPLGRIPFVIEQIGTGEKHVILTDRNGTYNSEKTAHSENTNALDSLLEGYNEGEGIPDEALETEDAGTWFGRGADGGEAEPDDVKKAFPYGTYSITELRCSANAGYDLIRDQRFFIDEDMSETGEILELNTLHNDPANPEIATSAADDVSNSHMATVGKDGKIHMTDTVRMEGLVPGKKYILRATLMNADLDEPYYALNEEGAAVPVHGETAFEATASKMAAEVPLDAFAAPGKGARTVVFEKLFSVNEEGKAGELAASHEDLLDKDQSMILPSVHTTVRNAGASDLEDRTADPEKEVTLIDTVEYAGLDAGKKYVISGTLVDANGESVTSDGEIVSAKSREFTPETSSGKEEVEFNLNASGLAGKKTVVFETLYLLIPAGEPQQDTEGEGGETDPGRNSDEVTAVEIARHEDLSDENQTIVFREKTEGGKPDPTPAPEKTPVPEKLTPVPVTPSPVPRRETPGERISVNPGYGVQSHPAAVRTGDETHMRLWAALAAGSALTAVLLLKRKRRGGRPRW